MPARRLASLVALTATTLLAATPSASAAPVPLPRPDHVLVVVMENKDPGEIIGNGAAPYLNGLARAGRTSPTRTPRPTRASPTTWRCSPASTQGVTDNGCDHRLTAPNLGSALLASGRTFAGYSEGLPRRARRCARRPTTRASTARGSNFTDLPGATTNLPASAVGTAWDRLPTVAFLTPDLCHDMHDCPVSAGDAWAKTTSASYLAWAGTHNSLLVLTFDESETRTRGQPDRHGPRGTDGDARPLPGRIDHYSLLRTIEDMYGLSPLGASADRNPITDIWRTPLTTAPEAPAGRR